MNPPSDTPYGLAKGIVRKDGAIGLIAVGLVFFMAWIMYTMVNKMDSKMDTIIELTKESTQVHKLMLRVMYTGREMENTDELTVQGVQDMNLARDVQAVLSPTHERL